MSDIINQLPGFAEEANAWHDNSRDLPELACKHLVNRTDVYGQYLPIHNRGKSSAKTVKAKVSNALIVQHFEACNKDDIIGFHTTSKNNTCREVDKDTLVSMSAITRFNLIEYRQHNGELDTYFDILDLGDWSRESTGDNLCGHYEPPANDWRKLIKDELSKGLVNQNG